MAGAIIGHVTCSPVGVLGRRFRGRPPFRNGGKAAGWGLVGPLLVGTAAAASASIDAVAAVAPVAALATLASVAPTGGAATSFARELGFPRASFGLTPPKLDLLRGSQL